MTLAEAHIPRHMLDRLKEAAAAAPVVLLQGPRQCGKSTLVQSFGLKQGYQYISFDHESRRRAAQDDPMGFIETLPGRVILDEAQLVPQLFRAIKLSVDSNRQPGRFILTGSSQLLKQPGLSDSLAGRMRILHLQPLSQHEIHRSRTSFLDLVFNQQLHTLESKSKASYFPTREIVAGGYPEVYAHTYDERHLWCSDYIQSLTQNDIPQVLNIRAADALPKLMQVLASQTARLVNTSRISSALSLSRPTVQQYISLLEQVFLITQLPAWFHNRLTRVVKAPKLHISDTSIACALLNTNEASFHLDPSLVGQLFESFVFQELRRMASYAQQKYNFYHYRNKSGDEVDLIIERNDGFLAGVDVKSSASVRSSDFNTLRKLKHVAPKRFVGNMVVYTGTECLKFDAGWAVPIQNFWQHK